MLISYSDFTVLFSGFLLTLSVYHFLLYFQHKDRVYLYYSFYTFLIFTASYPNNENTVFTDVTTYNDAYFQLIIVPREWIYNTLYLIFAKTLVALHIYKPKWNRILNISIVFYFILLFLAIIYALLTGNNFVVGTIYAYFFSPTIAILALISFYMLYTMETSLKYYVLIGSFIYLILAESAFFITKDTQTATIIFYIGVIIENILFSLALGHKQKIILQEKNESQKELIVQLEQNAVLKSTIQEQLEKDLILLNNKAEINKLEKIKANHDKELAELKVSALKSQMNPHFIFNSLNSIKLYIINNEKENAVYYLNKFSKLIRKTLAATREKEISLAEEIETMELYINIENIRFSNEIIFTLDIDEHLKIDTIKIPSLILQPFIENAIWHGLASKKGIKKLNVLVKKHNTNYVKIHIIDNGIGREKSAIIKSKKASKNKSLGLAITKQRLEIFVGDFFTQESIVFKDLYENNAASGTEVIVQIPIKKQGYV